MDQKGNVVTTNLNTVNDKQNGNDNERLELIIKAAGVGVWDWQVQTGELTFNERWAEIIGHTVEELQPIKFDTWSDNLHPDDFERASDLLKQHFDGVIDHYEVEARMKHKLGHYVWVMASGRLVDWDANGRPLRMIGTHIDITERKVNEERLAVTSQLLNESQQVAKLGGWELDLLTGNLYWTDETYRIHDTSPDVFDPTVDAGVDYFLPESKAIISNALDEAINNGIGYDLELETLTTKGRKIDVRTTCTVTVRDGKPIRLAGIFQDITEYKSILRKLENSNVDLEKANSALQSSAYYDALTKLPNRILLADRMQLAITKSARNKKNVAIAFIDLDGFKEINDNYDHSLGDEVLIDVGKKINQVLRDGDTLSRIGGDEFVALIDDLDSPGESEAILVRMLEAVSAIEQVNHHIVDISASIGVTYYPLDGSNPDQLIRHADQAMYVAKQQGKNRFHVFDIEQDVALKNRTEELKIIALALSNNEFELYFQPKVDLSSSEVIGVEALIRWNHPEKGVLPPAMFLPAIEHDVLGIEVGNWVVNTALKQLKAWSDLGLNVSISVNISPMHLQRSQFISELKSMLDQYPEDIHENLELEILESSAFSDITLVSNIIKKCNELGVRFSIDDFGTGYSSLTYLKRLPAEYLKIDQSFVRDMLLDEDDKAIIQGIIELAKVFNLKVIAEGVETPEHGEQLLSLGCYLAQGYGIAKPMPGSYVLKWLASWKQNPRLVDGTL
jgi:diguanylate cyclase (GGDEF)-like protein/PAS domain S-box-containing protein